MVRLHLEYEWALEPSSQKGYKQTRKQSKEGFQICKKKKKSYNSIDPGTVTGLLVT